MAIWYLRIEWGVLYIYIYIYFNFTANTIYFTTFSYIKNEKLWIVNNHIHIDLYYYRYFYFNHSSVYINLKNFFFNILT